MGICIPGLHVIQWGTDGSRFSSLRRQSLDTYIHYVCVDRALCTILRQLCGQRDLVQKPELALLAYIDATNLVTVAHS